MEVLLLLYPIFLLRFENLSNFVQYSEYFKWSYSLIDDPDWEQSANIERFSVKAVGTF